MRKLAALVTVFILFGGGVAHAYDWRATTTGAKVEVTGNYINVFDTACDNRGATGKWTRTGHSDVLAWHNGQGCNTSSGYTTGGVVLSVQACTTRPLQNDRCGGWVGRP